MTGRVLDMKVRQEALESSSAHTTLIDPFDSILALNGYGGLPDLASTRPIS